MAAMVNNPRVKHFNIVIEVVVKMITAIANPIDVFSIDLF